MTRLRSYQQRAIEAARIARKGGARRILMSCPTGGGKTVIATAMIATAIGFGSRVVVIVHRKELVDQFNFHLRSMGIAAGVMRGCDERTDPSAVVQLATIQTLVRRVLPPADLVIVDECHRVPSDSYARTLEAYPRATVFGLTATPCRLDGRPLREHFDAMVQVASYSELIDQGAILAPIVYAARKPPDLAKVRTVAGDYHEKDLELAVREPHVIGDVVAEWKAHSDGRRTVVFAVGIDHSNDLAERFGDEGARVAHLDGTTPEYERSRILLDLELGKLDVVCNVGVLTEGWDQPKVKCAVMARPTKSLTLWMQCAGRILRPWGEQAPLILDHSGNVDRHGLPHEDREWSLDGAVTRRPSGCLRVCQTCYGYVDGSPCPLCGAVAAAGERRELRKADGVLERIGKNIEKERSSDPKRAYFDDQVEQAQRKGFKPGYASAKFKEKFGAWPSWAWSQGVKADFAKNAEWQGRVAKKTREREFWQKQQQAGDSLEDVAAPAEEGAFDGLGVEWSP